MTDLAEPVAGGPLGTGDAPPGPAPAPPRGGLPRLRHRLERLRDAALAASPAIGLYLGLRLLSLDVLATLVWVGHAREPDRVVYWDGSTDTWRGYRTLADVLLSWDGRWYSLIAERGYEHLAAGAAGAVDEHGVPYTYRLAFFPLYPYLARSLTWLPGMTGGRACLVVSLLASVAAAWGLFAIGNHLHGRRVGVLLAALWAVVPAGMTENGGFTESLFTALCAWALYAVMRRRWLVAGALTAITGLTRPTAIALVATVGLAAVYAVVRRRDGWRPVAAAALSPLGYGGYVLFAGHYLGGPDGFFRLQRYHWDSYFDFGRTTAQNIDRILFLQDQYKESIFLLTLSVVIAVAVLTILAAVDRTPWVLVVFAAVMLVGSVGSHAHFASLERHLLPVFPALIIPAVALARARFRTLVVLLPILAILSGWYGGWLPFTSGQVI